LFQKRAVKKVLPPDEPPGNIRLTYLEAITCSFVKRLGIF
jgi:hypothetical protein